MIALNTAALSTLKLKSERETHMPLSSLWENDTVLIVFVRHFASKSCWDHVRSIWANKEKIFNSSLKLVFVGNGSAESIETFKKEFEISNVPFFTDPTLESFVIFGMHNKKYQVQVGGMAVIKPSSEVVFHFVSDHLATNETGPVKGPVAA